MIEVERPRVLQEEMETMEDAAAAAGGLQTREMKNKMMVEKEHGNSVLLDLTKGAADEVTEVINGLHLSGLREILPSLSGALDISIGSTSTTEVHEIAVVGRDENVTKGEVKVKEYDLEKILGEQETHDLYCPNCKASITRKVVLVKKRKRSGPEPDEPRKRPQPHEEPDPELPFMFRCLSCFTTFFPNDCGFNLFRIFERRDDATPEVPSAPRDPSQHCGSWLFSCFPAAESPKEPANNVDQLKKPLRGHSSTSERPDDKTSDEGSTLPMPASPATVYKAEHVPEASVPQPVDPEFSPDIVVQVLPVDETPTAVRAPERRDEWDILKPIVYGGLVESITSLSVVSAAASSGANTLNVFVLGIANLIGGLPVIYHNIANLRSTTSEGVSADERSGQQQYRSELGTPSRYWLHMALAVASYILFGLLPPVIYGASFRDAAGGGEAAREKKMAAVAGASLACIALLALGKAHAASGRAYGTTLFYYLSVGFSGSGLSYVGGVLVTMLLAHFGLVVQQGGAGAPPAPPSLFSPHQAMAFWASF